MDWDISSGLRSFKHINYWGKLYLGVESQRNDTWFEDVERRVDLGSTWSIIKITLHNGFMDYTGISENQ